MAIDSKSRPSTRLFVTMRYLFFKKRKRNYFKREELKAWIEKERKPTDEVIEKGAEELSVSEPQEEEIER
jgi:hypothetical protein